MEKRLKELQERLPEKHKEMTKLLQHVFDALHEYEVQHRKLVASDALAGIKPNGEEEKKFYEELSDIKKIMLAEMEKTVQDIEHKGDKNWKKNYKDGVNE